MARALMVGPKLKIKHHLIWYHRKKAKKRFSSVGKLLEFNQKHKGHSLTQTRAEKYETAATFTVHKLFVDP